MRSVGALEKFFPASVSSNSTWAHRDRTGPPVISPSDIGRYPGERLRAALAPQWSAWLQRQIEPLRPEITVAAGVCVRIHRFQAGRARLIAFERNVDYQMSEDLKQAGGNEALEKPVELDAALSRPGHVFDLRAQKHLGLTDRIHFTLDPWKPSLYAVTEEPIPEETIVQALARELEK
jgi:hypothetical protein